MLIIATQTLKSRETKCLCRYERIRCRFFRTHPQTLTSSQRAFSHMCAVIGASALQPSTQKFSHRQYFTHDHSVCLCHILCTLLQSAVECRAFPVAAAHVCNGLPHYVTSVQSPRKFIFLAVIYFLPTISSACEGTRVIIAHFHRFRYSYFGGRPAPNMNSGYLT